MYGKLWKMLAKCCKSFTANAKICQGYQVKALISHLEVGLTELHLRHAVSCTKVHH